MRTIYWKGGLIGFILARAWVACAGATNAPQSSFSTAPIALWQDGMANRFQTGTQEVDLSGGGGVGIHALGSTQSHDWLLGSVAYGVVITDVIGRNHWFRGNGELLGELFAGEQFHPTWAYLVGGGPHLRYNFVAGQRWVPFIDLGAGLTATDIRDGDLSTTFEFNLQAGAGIRWFVRDGFALTLQCRFIHVSNADIRAPNLGANSSTFLIGAAWVF